MRKVGDIPPNFPKLTNPASKIHRLQNKMTNINIKTYIHSNTNREKTSNVNRVGGWEKTIGKISRPAFTANIGRMRKRRETQTGPSFVYYSYAGPGLLKNIPS